NSKFASVFPCAGTSHVSSLLVLYWGGTLSPKGQPPRGGLRRASPSPISARCSEMVTLCLPTTAPGCPVVGSSIYSPFSLVMPLDARGASMESLSRSTGVKLPVAPSRGFPFIFTTPETGTSFFELQPSASIATQPTSQYTRMPHSPFCS